MHAIMSFFKQRPLVAGILAVIMVAASFSRLWQIHQSFHFMGDQGRDALIVSRIFTQGDLVFVGPAMSVGNIYLGPFYYYFMLPFLFLTYPSPVGPVYAVAVLNILTVLLLYFLGRKLVGDRAALFAAGMMAVSAVAIVHSRFSWNPNIIPFFSLLLMTASYYAVVRSPRYWVAAAVCVGILIQLHYVTLLSAVAALSLYLWQLWSTRKKKTVRKKVLLAGLAGAAVIVVLLSPLLLFDIKHDWLNLRALQSLATDEKNFVQAAESSTHSIETVLGNITERGSLIMVDKVIGSRGSIDYFVLLGVVLIVGIATNAVRKEKKDLTRIAVLLVYLSVGIVGFSFYQKDMYDHYIVYLLPATFLVLGYCLDKIARAHYLGWSVVVFFFFSYFSYNLPLLSFVAGGPTQENLRITADSIHDRVDADEPYAVVLLSESKDSYGMNYRYFLNVVPDKQPVTPERNSDAVKLFIINEEQKTDRPQDVEIYEVVTFGTTEPLEVYTLPQGISVTVLSKNRSSTP